MDKFRVLNLVNDPRWKQYLSGTLPGSERSNVELMKMSSEQYNRFFTVFCEQNKIYLQNYDMVVADDLHSGGSGRRTVQMVLLYKNAGYTTLHAEILSKMQLVEKNGAAVRVVSDPSRIVGGPNVTDGAAMKRSLLGMDAYSTRSPTTVKMERAALGAQTRNQKVVSGAQRTADAASLRWAGYGMAVAKLALWLNDAALEHRIREELLKRKTEITTAFDNNQGVLVVLHVAVQKYSEAGFLAQSFENLWLQPGSTPDEALTHWRERPGLFATLPANAPFRSTEQYRWLEIDQEF
jgi:hypothetical protein